MRLRGHLTEGQTRTRYRRLRASLEFETTGRDAFPIQFSGTFAHMMAGGAPHPFELLTIGGASSPVADSSLFSQRYSMPMFPTGIGVGRSLLAWRVALPTSTWTWFYEGASVTDSLVTFREWNRAVGVDMEYGLPPIPVGFAPRVYARGGVAYTLDQPFRKKLRFFLEMRVEP